MEAQDAFLDPGIGVGRAHQHNVNSRQKNPDSFSTLQGKNQSEPRPIGAQGESCLGPLFNGRISKTSLSPFKIAGMAREKA